MSVEVAEFFLYSFPLKIRFEDQQTHDTFEITVNGWIVVNEDEEGWKEYPIFWPGIETPKGIDHAVNHLPFF